MEKKEVRSFVSDCKVIEEEGRKISGYAVLFGVESRDLGFIETIDKRALDGVIEKSDVFAVLDHDKYRGILARCNKGKGSLSLEVDEVGLKYTFDAPRTALGDELLEYLKRGDISASSFAFDVESEKWEKDDKDKWYRTIVKIGKLYDVSPVFNPAYSDTSVALARCKEKENESDKVKIEELKGYFEALRNGL